MPLADAGPPVEVIWELRAPDVDTSVDSMGPLGDDLVVMGATNIIVSREGTEKARRRLGDWPHQGLSFGSGFSLFYRKQGYATVKRFGIDLELIAETPSPNGGLTREAWAPGPASTWLLGQLLEEDLVSTVKLGEIPSEGEPRSWSYPDWPTAVNPDIGIVTAGGTPLFLANCASPGLATVCVLRVDVATGELRSVEIESGNSLKIGWMAETPRGVLVLYERLDAAGGLSYHAVLVDPDGPTVLAGPSLLVGKRGNEDVTGLVVLGDYAYSSGGPNLFRFELDTLSNWTRYPVPFPDGAEWTNSFGVGVVDDELYHFIGVVPPFGTIDLLVQKLVPPPP